MLIWLDKNDVVPLVRRRPERNCRPATARLQPCLTVWVWADIKNRASQNFRAACGRAGRKSDRSFSVSRSSLGKKQCRRRFGDRAWNGIGGIALATLRKQRSRRPLADDGFDRGATSQLALITPK